MGKKGEQVEHLWEKVFKNDLQGMLLPIVLMALIGVINIFSATYVGSITTDDGLWGYAPKHGLFLLVSAVFGVLLYRYDYRKLQNPTLLRRIMYVTAVLLAAIYFVGVEVNGARRWIPIGRFSLQPSEFVKVGMIVIFAGFFAELERRNKLKDPIWSVLVPLAIGGFVAGIIFFMQNHLSAAILVITTLLTQMFIAGINFKAFITLMISGLIGSYFVIQSIFKKASRPDLDRQE